MPIRQIGTPLSLEGPIDIEDEVEIDRIVNGRVRSLLTAPELRAELMPPGRRAWFEAFVKRSVEGALLLKQRDGLNLSWEGLEWDFLKQGVVQAILGILQTANDPDGKDERRGYAYSARCTERAFLQDRADVRETLKSAIVCGDGAEWRKYPAWYGVIDTEGHYARAFPPAERVALRRKGAARFLPIFEPEDPLLRGLLDDDVRQVRHVAAVRLAMLNPESADEKLLVGLLDAAADQDWVWSWGDEYDCDRRGRHEAFLLLERFGTQARAVVPLLKAEIATLQRLCGLKDYLAPWWEDWLAKSNRLVDVFEGRT